MIWLRPECSVTTRRETFPTWKQECHAAASEFHTPPLHPWWTAHTQSSPQGKMFRAQAIHDRNDPQGLRNVLQKVHSFSKPSIYAFSPLKKLASLLTSSFSKHSVALLLIIFGFLDTSDVNDPKLNTYWSAPSSKISIYLFILNYKGRQDLFQCWLNVIVPDSSRDINSGERVHFVT